MIRSLIFNIAYWLLSVLYVLMAAVALALPGRAVAWVVRRYSRRMVQAMRLLAGIRLSVVGRQHVPEGACIIAAKHHSWFDGFSMYSQFDDVAFVTGDHLEKIPLLGGILQKLGAIVVNNCGGHKARAALANSAAKAHAAGRRILIYPEGHLSKAGERFRYKTGVYHMYANFGLPVVPVATNLGLFAPQRDFAKHPGETTLEFLEPIQPGLSRAEFMARLENAIETRTDELIAQARGTAVVPSVLVADPAAAPPGTAAAPSPSWPMGAPRLQRPDPAALTGRSREVYDDIATSRGGVRGPFLALLHSPELADRFQKLGAYVRYETLFSEDVREVAILATAQRWASAEEWRLHEAHGRKAGLSDVVIADLRAGRRSPALTHDQGAAFDFVTELHDHHVVSEAAYAAAMASFGPQATVELAVVAGYYAMIAMTLNAHQLNTPPAG